jgi:hypothetical protein
MLARPAHRNLRNGHKTAKVTPFSDLP